MILLQASKKKVIFVASVARHSKQKGDTVSGFVSASSDPMLPLGGLLELIVLIVDIILFLEDGPK